MLFAVYQSFPLLLNDTLAVVIYQTNRKAAHTIIVTWHVGKTATFNRFDDMLITKIEDSKLKSSMHKRRKSIHHVLSSTRCSDKVEPLPSQHTKLNGSRDSSHLSRI